MDRPDITSDNDSWSEDERSYRDWVEFGPLTEEQATLQLFQISNDLFYDQDNLIDPVFGDANPTYGQDLYEAFMTTHPEFRPLYEPALRSPPREGFVMPSWEEVNQWLDYLAE